MEIKVTKVCFTYYGEAEYVAITEAYKELLWSKRLMQELGFP